MMATDMWSVSTSPPAKQQIQKHHHDDSAAPAVDPYARAEDEYNAWLKDSPSMKGVPCKYFSFGGCNKGNACPYSHDLTVEPKSDEDTSRGFVLMGGANVANLPGAQENTTQQPAFEQPQFVDGNAQPHQRGGEWDAPTGNVPPANYYGDDTPYQTTQNDGSSWQQQGSRQQPQHQPGFGVDASTGRNVAGSRAGAPWGNPRRRGANELRNMPTHEYAAHQQAEFVRRFQDYTNARTTNPPPSNAAAAPSTWGQQQQPLTGVVVNGVSPQPTKRRMPSQIASGPGTVDPAANLFQPQHQQQQQFQSGKSPSARPFQPNHQQQQQQGAYDASTEIESQYNEAVNNFGFRRQQAMRAPLSMSAGPGAAIQVSNRGGTPPVEPIDVSSRRRPPQLSTGNLDQQMPNSNGSLGTPFSATSSAASPSSFPATVAPSPVAAAGHASNASSTTSPLLGAANPTSAQLSASEHRKLRNTPVLPTTSPWSGAPLAVDL